ncbi:glycosyltransferase [Bifidobacterium pseudocatenulatum]|nr:glycosyltransferase [Bifidobacterium pseudocatenulatum]
MEPLVSIITPAFNASRYLVSFFESVLNQDYSNYELIFINDGSTDDTAQIALRYKKKF